MAKAKRMSSEKRKAMKGPDALEQAVAGAVQATSDNSATLIKAGIALLAVIVAAILFFSFKSAKDGENQAKLAKIDKIFLEEQSSYEQKMQAQQEKFREVLSAMTGKGASDSKDLQEKLATLRQEADAIQPDFSKSAAMYEEFYSQNAGTKQAGIAALQVAAGHLQPGKVAADQAEAWLQKALDLFSSNLIMGAQIRQTLMGLYEDQGSTDKALAMADQNIRSPAQHIKDYARLAKARILKGSKPDEAKALLDKILTDEKALYKDQARALRSSI
jgi:hypothetical protein